MRKYFVYVDDGKSVSKIAVPAESEDRAKSWCREYGEIVAVVDVTEHPIYSDRVSETLQNAGFTSYEANFILKAFADAGIGNEFNTPFKRGGDL